MQVSRAVLLETTSSAIERYEKAQAAYSEGAKRWKAQHRKTQVSDALAKQKRARDALSTAVKARKPLTQDQIRDALGGRSYLSDLCVPSPTDPPRRFTLDGVVYQRPDGVPLTDLKALQKTLESVLEDIISDGQLQRLGFKNMGWVFRAAMTNAPADA